MIKSLATIIANEYFAAIHLRTIIAWPAFAYSAKKPRTSGIAIANLTEHAWRCIELRLILRHFNFSFSWAVLCNWWWVCRATDKPRRSRHAVLDGSRSGCISVLRCECSATEQHRRCWRHAFLDGSRSGRISVLRCERKAAEHHRCWRIAVLLYGQLIGTCHCTAKKWNLEHAAKLCNQWHQVIFPLLVLSDINQVSLVDGCQQCCC